MDNVNDFIDSDNDNDTDNDNDNDNHQPIHATVEEALNKYYQLKSKYEEINNAARKKVMDNHPLLSMKQKRAMYRTLPKCIKCAKNGGTIFSIEPGPDTKTLSAVCGHTKKPCTLNIEIKLMNVTTQEKMLKTSADRINLYKNKIIEVKNLLLFGYTRIVPKAWMYSRDQELISEESEYTAHIIGKRRIKTSAKKEVITRLTLERESLIVQIKSHVEEFNKTQDIQHITNAVEVYKDELISLNRQIMDAAFSHSTVVNDTNTCTLMQSVDLPYYNEVNIDLDPEEVNEVKSYET